MGIPLAGIRQYFMKVAMGPQLPNCQMQRHFTWLVVSPLRQKEYSSGNLVLAGILAHSLPVSSSVLSQPSVSDMIL